MKILLNVDEVKQAVVKHLEELGLPLPDKQNVALTLNEDGCTVSLEPVKADEDESIFGAF